MKKVNRIQRIQTIPYIGPNHLLLTMLQTFVWQHCQWHCLQKIFCLKLPNSVRKEKKLLEAMTLAMLPTKSLQDCHDQMIRAIFCSVFPFCNYLITNVFGYDVLTWNFNILDLDFRSKSHMTTSRS